MTLALWVLPALVGQQVHCLCPYEGRSLSLKYIKVTVNLYIIDSLKLIFVEQKYKKLSVKLFY